MRLREGAGCKLVEGRGKNRASGSRVDVERNAGTASAFFCCFFFLCTTGDASPCSTRRSLAGSPKKPWETDNSVCGSALFTGVAANDLFRAGVNSVPVNAPWERCNPPGGNAATTQRKTIQE